MPPAIIAVATAIGTAVTSAVGATIGAAAANAVLALGFQQGIVAGISAWATVASIAAGFKRPNLPDTAAANAINFKADPLAPIPLVIGRSATGGNIIHATVSEPKNLVLAYLAVLSLGQIGEIESFSANGEATAFSGDNATNRYANVMFQRQVLGFPTPATFYPPAAPSISDWTDDHKLTGYAAAWWSLAFSQQHYPNGTPKPLWVLKGARVWDPREDSTYPGGNPAGPQRSDDPETWEWSENPGLHALTFALGYYREGRKVLGLGARPDQIEVAEFVECANVSDANGWKVGGTIHSGMNKLDVLTAMLAAGAAEPVTGTARLGCFTNSPKVSIATITGDQVTGRISIAASARHRDRINRIVPTYRSEAHGWEYVEADPVEVPDYITADGEERPRGVRYDLVQDAAQAAQLAAYDIVNAREFGPITMPLKLMWMGLKPGDCVTLDIPEAALVAQDCIVRRRGMDFQTMSVTLALRSETADKHDFALGLTANPPPTPSLDPFDALVLDPPGAGAWVATAVTQPGDAGDDIPAIEVAGASDNEFAAELLIRYRIVGAPAWDEWPSIPASATQTLITGVAPLTEYEVEVTYRSVRGVLATVAGVVTWTDAGTVTTTALGLAAVLEAISDGNLNPKDKLIAVPYIKALIGARAALRDRADDLNLTELNNLQRLAYEDAADSLDTVLATLTSPVAWDNAAGLTDIPSPGLLRTVLEDSATSERDLQSQIDAVYTVRIGDIELDLGEILDDDLILAPEKRAFIWPIRSLVFARAALRDAADTLGLTYGVAAERTAFEIQANALDVVLAALPGWDNYTLDTDLAAAGYSGAGLGDLLEDVYSTTFDLQAAVDARHNARVQSLDNGGKLTTVAALPGINDPRGNGLAISIFPLTSDATNIYIAASTVTGVGYSLAMPSATISGCASDTAYALFYQTVGGYYVAVDPDLMTTYASSADQWLFLGVMQTEDGGGTYAYVDAYAPEGYVTSSVLFNQYIHIP